MNLTVTKSTNQREVEMMFGKAMCAYANWKSATEHPLSTVDGIANTEEQKFFMAAYKSEYEATVRCIAMFVDESLPQVCKAVIDAAKEEFGI